MKAITNVYELVKEQMHHSNDADAISFKGESISYSSLEKEVELLARSIVQQAPTEKLIGISTERSISQIIAVLAIHHAGKAYLPLDTSLPITRLQQLIAESGLTYYISTDSSSFIHEQLSLLPIHKESVNAMIENTGIENDTAYVLFTSGSTGIPKGVSMGHSALINLIQWQEKTSLSGKGNRTLQFAPLSFDVSFQEIYATLIAGSCLYLIDDDTRLDAYRLIQFLIEHKIDRIFLPFVALQYLAEESIAQQLSPTHLREIITAGETLKITPQIKRFVSGIPGLTLCNQYGPTECHVVTELRLTGDPENWPSLPSIGKAIDNTSIYILDESLEVAKDGEIGELCIGGSALAQGYLNQAMQTEEKFVDWQHPTQGRIRIYRTGDEARFSADGNIEFLGRRDNQVKIRGYRIELDEIEIALCKIPGVAQAVVTANSNSEGEKKLVAYIIASNDPLPHTLVRNHLQKELPDYMIPSVIEWLTAFPKTASGKVDRKAMPSPKNGRPNLSVEFQQWTTVTQQKIVEYWKGLLQLGEIGIHDNFFDLGGNSLLAQKSISFLSELAGKRFAITSIYQYPTIDQLSKVIDGTMSLSDHQARISPTRHPNNKDIAIIGMALRFPGCETLDEYWELLQQGHEKIRFFEDDELDPSIPPEFKNDPNYVKARGIIKDADCFDADFFGLTPVVARLMDPQQRIFLELSREVLETSGYLPSQYEGTIGVFAGSGNNSYYLNNICSHPEEIAKIGAFQTMTLNEKDYVASRVAFQLNLKGPAVSVHSACSTSLLAIATAVKSIRDGECTLAIAGGVSITSPLHSGHLHQEGTMLSKDGHCRPFDSEATGTLFSDGAGAILLKDAESARQNGDHIYAIIKGTGINNDGQDKGSFTAPSAVGQAKVIQMAIQDAGIEATDISYIETHGTATPLGDPIEIEGLKMAFGNQKKHQYCRIGSVKGNFGHLTAAAGVAGVIKTVLSLYHDQIPPSINYQSANPHIDFENSPFIVNSTLSHWPDQSRKIAGVSSFGVGGTNVHLILQENKALTFPSTHTGPQLISWSSKKPESQRLYAEKLIRYLKKNPNCYLGDLAYSLQVSRENFSYRNYVVADSVPNLIKQLESVKVSEEKVISTNPPIVFLFPGQGSQSINMGRSLYQSEPTFKQAFDRCSNLLVPVLGCDLRELIFCRPTAEAEELIDQTQYTQPAIFTFCYSLAQLWLSWGVQPSAFVGHSLGELLAAHLAGVFTLEDALHMISKRGKLIAALPRGKMVSVRGNIAHLEAFLHPGVSVAALNAPNSLVFSGKTEDMDVFMEQLKTASIPHKPLHTSHAFHSAMLDPITDELEELIGSFSLKPPITPIVSTVTGQWLSNEEATNPAYWARQARVTVNYSSAIQFIENERKPIYLEVGIGSVCSTFVRQQGSALSPRCISGIDQDTDEISALPSVKAAIGKLWSLGCSIPWKLYYSNLAVHFLPDLPGYAYLKKSYWLDIPVSTVGPVVPVPSAAKTEILLSPSSLQPIIMSNPIITRLKASLEEITGLELANCDADSSFIELGLDSLLLTQAALRFKNEYQVPLTYRQLNEELNNLSSLAVYISENGKAVSIPSSQPEQPSMEQIKEQIARLSQQINQLTASPAPQKTNQVSDHIPTLPEQPFGASPRIHKEGTSLTPQQSTFIEDFIEDYIQKTRSSKSFTQANRKQTADPRVVSGFNPSIKEMIYPIVVNRSEGSKLWDIDGNEYIDALNGFGTNLLGYQPSFIKKALHEQIEKGFELGPQHPLAAEVCHLICEFTNFDRAALCNTGSEAVLGAIRIARTVTGKSLIVSFEGSYHGINDEVIVRSSKKSKSYPAAPGIPKSAVENMLVLEYGTEESLAIIQEKAADIAAVLVEPVQSRRPEFQPIDFLRKVREITHNTNSLLIFDEVITGFRSHGGGAQALFNIRADLATYGKVIGGGLPIGAIAGLSTYMDALDGGFWTYGDASIPEIGVTYFAGTFVRHPLVLATAKATLEYMKNAGPALQVELNKQSELFVNRLNDIAQFHSLPLYVARFSSLWKIKFKEDYPLQELLFASMRKKGIHILANFPCFLTAAHTQADINQIVSAFEESVKELMAIGLLPTPKKIVDDEIDSFINNRPPLPNAMVGKDSNGNPAWFIPDPNNKNKYLQIEF